MEDTPTTKEEIEKAYPEAYRLARRFHELYEENAPKFGYVTRDDTKEFDPKSPNGRTMAYVCKTIIDEEVEEALTRLEAQKEEEVLGLIEGIKEETRNFPMKKNGENWDDWNDGYDKALSTLASAIKSKGK